tara:strand:+ start:465 stop:752 length:288 start_codon:yes stop_codon:yes gene_type:complete
MNTEKSYQYKYKIQVPRKVPDVHIEDSMGRKWVKAETVSDSYLQWELDENTWYVWFKNNEDVPEEGEIIEFSDEEYTVANVLHFNRIKRAVVTFN